MNTKKLILLTLAGLVFGASSAANATCYKYGKVENVYQTTSRTYIYIKPISSYSTSTYHYCYTSDRDLTIAAHAAKDSNSYVRISGSARSCPSRGSAGICGTITRY